MEHAPRSFKACRIRLRVGSAMACKKRFSFCSELFMARKLQVLNSRTTIEELHPQPAGKQKPEIDSHFFRIGL
jgi:hypothetical protein